MQDSGVAEFWPGWVSGVVLSVLIVAYFWVTGRLLSSSGRVTAIIDRLRYGPQPEHDASPEELAEAMRLASIEAFGASAVEEALLRSRAEQSAREQAPPATPPAPRVRPRANVTWVGHLAFLFGLVIGGRVAQPFAPLMWSLGDGVWAGVVPRGALPYVLLLAGVLVGFGTRMAGGCPIGHGLCGMARGQPGSWASGIAFFAGGVALTWLVAAVGAS